MHYARKIVCMDFFVPMSPIFQYDYFGVNFCMHAQKNNLTEILHIFLIKSEMLDSHIILDENTLNLKPNGQKHCHFVLYQ